MPLESCLLHDVLFMSNWWEGGPGACNKEAPTFLMPYLSHLHRRTSLCMTAVRDGVQPFAQLKRMWFTFGSCLADRISWGGQDRPTVLSALMRGVASCPLSPFSRSFELSWVA